MSTILDALRKIEEENRTRNADARTRLLATPQRFDLRPPRRQRVSWLVSAGLIVGGIAVGAGLMGWGWYARLPSLPVVTTTNVPVPHAQPTPAPVSAPAATPAPPEPTTSIAPSVEPSPAAVPTQEPTIIVVSPSPPPVTTVALADVASTSVDPANPVQRSPFVNTAEPERIAPPPSAVEPRITTKPKPVRKLVPTPRVPVARETATEPAVEEPIPTPLEEDDVAAGTPSAPVEEGETEDGAETSPPPTPASVSFLQWSPEPEKRMAFIKVGDKPTALAHEGDIVNGVTVVKIRQGAVELRSGKNRWTLKTR